MVKPYVVTVLTDEVGKIIGANLVNNRECFKKPISLKDIPLFIYERVALLRLTDIDRTANGQLIGRKIDDGFFTVYIDKEEHNKVNKMLTGVNK